MMSSILYTVVISCNLAGYSQRIEHNKYLPNITFLESLEETKRFGIPCVSCSLGKYKKEKAMDDLFDELVPEMRTHCTNFERKNPVFASICYQFTDEHAMTLLKVLKRMMTPTSFCGATNVCGYSLNKYRPTVVKGF